jgi:hypothetical protein
MSDHCQPGSLSPFPPGYRAAGVLLHVKPAACGPTIDPLSYGDKPIKATQLLHDLGQSLWLDNITRDLLDSGTLQLYIDELSVTGLTRIGPYPRTRQHGRASTRP